MTKNKDKEAKKGAGKEPAPKRPVGRPSDYNTQTADAICAKMAEGYSLRSICEEESMPSVPTVFSWLRKFPEFLKQYEDAMELRAIYHAEELMDISDDGRNDWMEKRNKEGENVGWQVNGEAIQRSRLRVDTRKWIASKLLPKKYGDKIEHEHKGEITTIQVVKYSDAGKDNKDT